MTGDRGAMHATARNASDVLARPRTSPPGDVAGTQPDRQHLRASPDATNPARANSLHDADYYPTPPAATRALLARLPASIEQQTCLEPAAGGGHMSDVLAERFKHVTACDLHDPCGRGWGGHNFVTHPPAVGLYDWIVTNPPFKLASEFAVTALHRARIGVALLVRLLFVESVTRHRTLFAHSPPTEIWVFSERLRFVRNRLPGPDDEASAVCYAWFVWQNPDLPPGSDSNNRCGHGFGDTDTRLSWLPPGTLDTPGDNTEPHRTEGRIDLGHGQQHGLF